MEFEESLPSNSTFVGANTGAFTLAGHQFHQENDYDEDGRSSSPPPPPPPPPQVEEAREAPAQKPTKKGNSSAQGRPSFPFLRKNRRKEPSALHRINSPSTSPVDDVKSASARRTDPEVHNQREQAPALGGATQAFKANMDKASHFAQGSANDRLGETLENSTISIAGLHWRQQQSSAIDELREFEQIERQLDASSTFPQRSAVHPTSVAQAQAPTQLRTGGLDNTQDSADSGGWGDAYAADAHYRGASTAGRGQGGGGSRWGTDDAQDGGEEDRDEHYSSDPADEQEHYRSAPTADRHATRPVLARTSSPNHSVPAHSRPTAATSGAVRSSESPSWGRGTQPVQHSLDSAADTGWEEQDRDAGSDRGSLQQSGMTSRMSEATLRKITSRTAALQQQTRPTIERPTLADDTNNGRYGYEREEAPARPVHTRPVSAQRRQANTLSAASGSAQRQLTGKPRSGSAGPRAMGRSAGGAGGAGHTTAGEYTESLLAERAKELEAEIQTYRAENATLRKQRKAQEAALAEVVAQKEEVLRWAAEEKTRTLKWCEEQQQAAVRERNAAAKVARDARQQQSVTSVPIRKEKAEIDALQATVEKLKLEHDQATKKWKVTEHRLATQSKEHAAHAEDLKRQVLALESEKLQLLEFIGSEGLLIPKSLRATLARSTKALAETPGSGSKTGARGATASLVSSAAADALRGKARSRDGPGPGRDGGYVEEVDVEVVAASTNHYYAGSEAGPGKRPTGAEAASARSGKFDGGHGASTTQSVRATSAPRRDVSAPASWSRTGGVLGGSHTAARDSWARSSRSSRSSAGGRYEDCVGSDRDDLEDDSFRVSEAAAVRRSREVEGAHPTTVGAESLRRSAHPSSPARSVASAGPAGGAATESTQTGTGRVEEFLPDGGKRIRYKNGTEKVVDADGNAEVRFLNGDTKKTIAATGEVVYFYAEANTTHTTYADGLEVYRFPNQQVELHFPDGIKEIVFADGTRKIIHPSGLQESHFPDGVILREHADGRREVLSHEQE